MNLPYRVIVSFAGSAVAIDVADACIAEVVNFLIHPSLVDQTKTPHCVFHVKKTNDEPVVYFLFKDSDQIYTGDSIGNLAETLQSMVCHELADRSRDGLLFHAGALADSGRGILIPGSIGAGKSTLTTWLLSKGLGYMTDELVYIPFNSDEMIAYTRPLHLKYPSREVLFAENIHYLHGQSYLSSSFSDLVAVQVFTQHQITHPIPLKLALFPKYDERCEFHWQDLNSAQTGQYLMQCLINARNLPDYGFHETARLARMINGHAFQYSHFDQIRDKLKDILFIV